MLVVDVGICVDPAVSSRSSVVNLFGRVSKESKFNEKTLIVKRNPVDYFPCLKQQQQQQKDHFIK